MVETKERNEQIKKEKRRRNQIYTELAYYLKQISYFDFFSKDAFQIVIQSQIIAQVLNQSTITPNILLFSFFSVKNELSTVLEKYELNIENIYEVTISHYVKDWKLYPNINELFNQLFSTESDKNVSFSDEVYSIFEKASHNARFRFKTPVISSEILFLTLMENNKLRSGKIIQLFMDNPDNDTLDIPKTINWYLLRYELLKRIHYHESTIKEEVSINYQYFAYLLKLKISDLQFDHIIENQNLPKVVFLFRNILVSNILKKNIFGDLLKDIRKSMTETCFRKYSS